MRPNYYRIENPDGSTKDCYQNDSYIITMTRNNPNEEIKINADIFNKDMNTVVRQLINDLGQTTTKMNDYKSIIKTNLDFLRLLVQSKILPENIEKQLDDFIGLNEAQIFSQDTSVKQMK